MEGGATVSAMMLALGLAVVVVLVSENDTMTFGLLPLSEYETPEIVPPSSGCGSA
jgi:hypothetical protein